jgi:hypothetical protein
MSESESRSPKYAEAIMVLRLSNEDFGREIDREKISMIENDLMLLSVNSEHVEYDGHDLGAGLCKFYLYSNDHNTLNDAVESILKDWSELSLLPIRDKPTVADEHSG